MAYPEGLLTSGERVREHLRPHVRMLVVPVLVPPLTAGAGMWLAALVARQPWHAGAWVVLAVAAAVVVARFALTPLLRWWCTHLVVTDRRLLVREGVLRRSGVDLPASTITDVRTGQHGVERLLGCGTLLVATRDTDGDPWSFHGIPRLAQIAARLGAVAEERGGLRDPAGGGDRADDGWDDDEAWDDEAWDGDAWDGDSWDEDSWDDEPIEGELVEDDEPVEPAVRRRARRSADRTSR